MYLWIYCDLFLKFCQSTDNFWRRDVLKNSSLSAPNQCIVFLEDLTQWDKDTMIMRNHLWTMASYLYTVLNQTTCVFVCNWKANVMQSTHTKFLRWSCQHLIPRVQTQIMALEALDKEMAFQFYHKTNRIYSISLCNDSFYINTLPLSLQ